MLLNLIHVNLNVADLDRSVAFYERLGMQVMQTFGDREKGIETEGGRVRGCVMSISDDPRAATKIELLQWLEPVAEPAPPPSLQRLGVGRIAIRVKGFEAHVERLRSKGAAFAVEPTQTALAGARVFCVIPDPDGNLIELIELA